MAALEQRALLATNLALDPTFAARGGILGPTAVSQGIGSTATSAVAVQSNGQIVTVDVNSPTGTNADGTSTTAPLTVHRYNADGSVDTSFGTGGQTVIPFPSATKLELGPRNLVITPTGQIVFGADLGATDPSGTFIRQEVVVRLSNIGQLDSSFGTSGIAALPMNGYGVTTVAVESSGRIVTAELFPTGATRPPSVILVGLTSTGAIDTSFHFGGTSLVPAAATITGSSIPPTVRVDGLLIDSNGRLLLGVDTTAYSIPPAFVPRLNQFTLTRLSADGTIDSTFGTSGTVDPNISFKADAFAIQPSGRIILGGTGTRTTGGRTENGAILIGLTLNGAIDPTFAAPAIPPLATSPFTALAITDDGSITALISGEADAARSSGGIAVSERGGSLYRFHADGTADLTFGRGGRINLDARPNPDTGQTFTALALNAAGNILVGGQLTNLPISPSGPGLASGQQTSNTLLDQFRPNHLPQVVNNYEGLDRSVPAVELTTGYFAYQSQLSGDIIQQFGLAGVGNAIPVPGDYDGDGRTDVALYLPSRGVVTYRPSGAGSDVEIRFGPTGAGQAIPVPGDYDGDGKTDVAFYLPGPGSFIVMPSDGAAPYQVQFGAAGTGQSIPAPGDFDDDGRTDLAVYLPSIGVFAYRASGAAAGTPDFLQSFGSPGAGNTLIAPGDYDGDGRTDVAGYLPNLGVFAFRPSMGGTDITTHFGPTGPGAALPVPGDYDGDGRTDVALFLPDGAVYAIAPSNGSLFASGKPYATQFGAAGAGNTVPATVVPLIPGLITTMSLQAEAASDPAAGVVVFLPDDLPGSPAKRRQPSA